MPRPLFRSFRRDHRGVALIEFAIVFPVLFMLLFGTIEVVRLMLIHQKLEKTGYVLADIVTQYLPANNPPTSGEITEAELNINVFPQMRRIMNPYDDTTRQAIILTSVRKESGTIKIKWQIAGGGTLSGCDTGTPSTCVTSIVNGQGPASPPDSGVLDTNASFPGQVTTILATMPDNENMIVSEVFYYYQPILMQLLQGVGNAGYGSSFSFYLRPKIYVKRTYFAPRMGPLVYLPPTFPAP